MVHERPVREGPRLVLQEPHQQGEAGGYKWGAAVVSKTEWLIDTGAQISVVTNSKGALFDLTPAGGSASGTTGGGGILIKSGLKMIFEIFDAGGAAMQVTCNLDIGVKPNDDGSEILGMDQIERVGGYPRQELLGQPMEMLIPERFKPDLRRAFVHALSSHVTDNNRTLSFQRKDGTEFTVELGLNAIDTPNGLHLLASIIDITEREQQEAAFRLAKFSMDQAAEAIYWIDPQANILDVNNAASLMLGYSKDELCAMTVHDLNPDFQANMWPEFWAESQRRGTMVFEDEPLTKLKAW